MRHVTALGVLMVLCACDSPPPMPVVGGTEPFSVAVHLERRASDLQKVADQYGQHAEVDGFTIMTRRGTDYRCEIHIVRPRDLSAKTQELLGHEFAHCLYGQWHP